MKFVSTLLAALLVTFMATASPRTHVCSPAACPQTSSLFGVNLSGPEFAPWNGQTFPTYSDFSYLRTQGIKLVRLPIAWESVQPTLSAALDATYLGKILTAVANANSNGIGVIVDLHNFAHYCDSAHWASSGCGYAGNDGNAGTGVSILGDATLTQSAFTDLWTRLATALVGKQGLVGYDIMNEPKSIVGTNLFDAPNYFGNTLGSQAWSHPNSTLVKQAIGSNPISSAYGPAWDMDSGTGFGSVFQQMTLSAVPYDLSVWAKTTSGTQPLQLAIGSVNCSKTVTTSWQRWECPGTPTAGSGKNIQIVLNGSGAGRHIQIANAQLELGSSPTTYAPSPWSPYAQVAITAIRAVDASTPIYVMGTNVGQACKWQIYSYEMDALTGGNLIFEAHQYFDGTVAQCGGGGGYVSNYSSFAGLTAQSGVTEIQPFTDWLASTGLKGFLGEFGVPNLTTDSNAQWLILQNVFEYNLAQNRIPATMWFYNSNNVQPANILGVVRHSGADDIRLKQMTLVPQPAK